MKTAEERFWAKVEKTDTCWLWIGSLTPQKYGQFSFNGKPVGAHRFSWELHNGKILEDLYVLHSCDIRNCVNPNHLFLGTHQDNMVDMVKKSRGCSKLTEKDIKFIKTLANYYPRLAIAKKYNISKTAINKIIKEKTWKHLLLENKNEQKMV